MRLKLPGLMADEFGTLNPVHVKKNARSWHGESVDTYTAREQSAALFSLRNVVLFS